MSAFGELDRTDRQILSLLQKNARLANNRIAAEVGIAASTCLERIRRLHRSRILTGYHASVDKRAVGIRIQALIAVRLAHHVGPEIERFEREVLDIDEVLALFHVTGDNDFLVQVGVRDSDHLRELTMGAFTSRPDVDHIQTSLIFDHRSKTTVPILLPNASTLD